VIIDVERQKQAAKQGWDNVFAAQENEFFEAYWTNGTLAMDVAKIANTDGVTDKDALSKIEDWTRHSAKLLYDGQKNNARETYNDTLKQSLARFWNRSLERIILAGGRFEDLEKCWPWIEREYLKQMVLGNLVMPKQG